MDSVLEACSSVGIVWGILTTCWALFLSRNFSFEFLCVVVSRLLLGD